MDYNVWEAVDEDVLRSKNDVLHRWPYILRDGLRVGALIGGQCSSLNLVDIPVLADVRGMISHEDLDVFVWLSECPYPSTNVADLGSNRRCLEDGSGDGNVKTLFYFMHYDQDSMKMLGIPERTTNSLVQKLVDADVIWHGEILVVKTMRTGEVANMELGDLDIVTRLLVRFVGSD